MLQSKGSQRVRHDLATEQQLSFFRAKKLEGKKGKTFCPYTVNSLFGLSWDPMRVLCSIRRNGEDLTLLILIFFRGFGLLAPLTEACGSASS